MIIYLLDTDTCIHAIKKRNRGLSTRIERHAGELAISDLTVFELHYGSNKYAAPAARVAIIEEFAENLKVLPFNTECAKQAATVRHDLASDGNMIGPFDVLIAATALTHKLVLVTGNAREFSRIKDLRIENWIA